MQPLLVFILSSIIFYIYFNISEVHFNRKERKRIYSRIAEIDDDLLDLNKFRAVVSIEFYRSNKLRLAEEKDLLGQSIPKKRGFFK